MIRYQKIIQMKKIHQIQDSKWQQSDFPMSKILRKQVQNLLKKSKNKIQISSIYLNKSKMLNKIYFKMIVLQLISR